MPIKKDYLIILFILLIASAFAGDPSLRKKNTHSGNQVRTTFFNYGLIGRENAAQDFGGEWPINSGHFYMGDISFMVGAEVIMSDSVAFHSVEVADGPRGSNDVDPTNTNIFWGWEPVEGYDNPSTDKVAMSHQPETWPAEWDGWLGVPGNEGIADQEGFFVLDDDRDREFYKNYGFQPDSTNPDRYGMGWRVNVHTYQFGELPFQDALIFSYDIINEGTTTYNKTFFSMIVGTTIGGDGDTGDDNANFDFSEDLVYAWDGDGIGGTGWNPVGYHGLVLLETPGSPNDGIDNDGDGLGGEGDIIDESLLIPKVIQVGDPVVLINYFNHQRTVSTFPAEGIEIIFKSDTIHISAGDTLFEKINSIDDNLNGIIDENTEIPDNGIDDNNNTLIDEYNHHLGKKYINYFSGAGLNNPLIDESKNDGVDNNGNWDLQTDDTGEDGILNTDDFGEGDGLPTAGEPHFDETDPEETDQIGLTSFFYFSPFNFVRLRNDDQLWEVNHPGFYNSGLQNVDGDYIFGSGYFQLLPGHSQLVSVAMVYGDNYNDLIKTANNIEGLWNNNLQQRILNIDPGFPPAGSSISGSYTLELDDSNDEVDPVFDIYASVDFGKSFWLVAENIPNHSQYELNTVETFQDGVFNKLRVVERKDNFVGYIESDSVFTINNEDNGTPQVMFVQPFPPKIVNNSLDVFWIGADPEQSSTKTDLFIKLNPGDNWIMVATGLPGWGFYRIDTKQFPNTIKSTLKIEITDSINSSYSLLADSFAISNIVEDLQETQIIHEGHSDGKVNIFIADSSAVTDHQYKLTFSKDNDLKYYSIYDKTDFNYKLQNQLLPDFETVSTQVTDGFFLQLDDVPEIIVDTLKTGWSNEEINIPFLATRMALGFAQGITYPADYDIIYADAVIDTSSDRTIFGLPATGPTPVNFTIRNLTDGNKSEFYFFKNPADSSDFIIIWEKIEEEMELTWLVKLQYPESVTTSPAAGDTFHLEIKEPFSENDTYHFTMEGLVLNIINMATLPQQTELYQNYPNPFNPSTTISFYLKNHENVKLEIFDILGRRVKTILNNKLTSGLHNYVWNSQNEFGETVASGVYFYRIETEPYIKTKKLLLLR